jgi:hypothetical protein
MVIGGFSSAPIEARVGSWDTSRIGTRMSGRLPSTKIFREFGNGRVTASDTRAVLRMKSSGMALMVFPRGSGRTEETGRHGRRCKLPSAGASRIRFKGTLSAGSPPAPPA